jgi:hypothetical protein
MTPPQLTEAEALELLAQHYGLTGATGCPCLGNETVTFNSA